MSGQENTPQQAALGWVKDGLDETLQGARSALDTYVESPDDSSLLATVAEKVKVAQGTLEMLEFFGAAMLAEEVTALAQYLADGKADNADQALEVLTGGVLQLPDYLDQLLAGRPDLPLMLLPTLNDLRAARHASLLSENLVFLPDLSLHEASPGEKPALREVDGQDIAEVARKLRSVYQFGFIGLHKNQDVESALDRLQKVAERLERASRHERIARFWWIIGAVVESIRFKALESSVAVKLLVAKADREIKRLIDEGEAKVSESQPLDLIRNLLYYLASAEEAGEKSKAVKEAYRLSEFLPREGDGGMTGLNAAVLSSVSESIKADIDEIKSLIEVYVSADLAQTDKLSPAADKLRTVADTLAMLGQGSMRQTVLEELETIKAILDGSEQPSQDRLLDIAGTMLRVESSLDDYAHGRKSDEHDDPSQGPALSGIRATVVNEALQDLRKVKEAITDYILDSSQRGPLEETPRIIGEMRGALLVANLERVVPLTDELHRYLAGRLLKDTELPDSAQLEILGEAVASIEYYLEAVRDNRVDADAILDAAEQGLDFLAQSVSVDADQEPGVGEQGLQTETPDEDEAGGAELELSPPESDSAPEVDLSSAGELQSEQSEQTSTEDSRASRSGSSPTPVGVADEAIDLEDYPVMEGEADEELLEIFLEEATEEVQTIQELMPRWRDDSSDEEALTTVRRAFHTLKGSGRMIGAKRIGEFAWEHENLLNRVIDGSVPASAQLFGLFDASLPVLAGLVDQLQSGTTPEGDVAGIMATARSLAQPDSDSSEAMSETLSFEVRQLGMEGDDADQDAADLEQTVAGQGEQRDESAERADAAIADDDRESPPEVDDGEVGEILEISALPGADAPEAPEADGDPLQAESIELVAEGPDGPGDQGEEALGLEAEGQSDPANLEAVVDAEDLTDPTPSIEPPSEQEDAFLELQASMSEYEVDEGPVELVPMQDAVPGDDGAEEITLPEPAEVPMPVESAEPADARGEAEAGPASQADIEEDPGDPFGQAAPAPTGAGAPGDSPPSASPTSSDAGLGDATPDPGFDPELLEIFKTEVDGHLAVLDAVLSELPPDQPLTADEALYRALHTVKGAGRTGGFTSIADLAASLERLVRQRHDDGATLEDEEIEILREGTQALHDMTDALATAGGAPVPVDELVARAAAALERPVESSASVSPEPAAPAVEVPPAETVQVPDDELVQIFLEEAQELLDQIETTLQAWGTNLADKEPVKALQRQLHTVKGGARMAGLGPIGDLSHALESLFIAVVEDKIAADKALHHQLNSAFDRLYAMITSAVDKGSVESDPLLVLQLEAARKGQTLARSDVTTPAAEGPADAAQSDPAPEAGRAPVEAVEDLPQVETVTVPDDDLVPIFLEEAQELVDQIETTLQAWGENLADKEPVKALQRQLHTVKGGARMSGLTPIGDLSHSLESLFIALVEDRVPASRDLHHLLNIAFDRLSGMVTSAAERGFVQSDPGLVAQLEAARSWGSVAAAPEAVDASPAAESAASASSAEPAAEALTPRQEPESAVQPPASEAASAERRNASRAAQETVRVRAGLLDNLVNVAGEVSIYRSRIEQQIGAFGSNLGEFEQTITRLREQLRSLELETEAQVMSSHRQMMEQPDAAFDPLEMDRYSRMQELSRALAESVNDLVSIQSLLSESVRDSETLLLQQSRLSTDLQDGLMRTRMVQVGNIMPRLRRIVRQTCDELGKDATLTLEGAEHEIDSKIIDRMVAPLEHLLRNAVAHGVEPQDERRAHGKPETGSIHMQVTREGSEVVIRVKDDGRGIDVEKIRAKALKQGLMDENQEYTEHEIMQFILESGFSTADSVSQIAGRGVGMDVVHSEIKQLGGALQIDSILGRSTIFTARLPFTLAINQAVLVQVHDETYALPVVSIDGIARLSTSELKALYEQDHPAYRYGEIDYEVHYLGELLGMGDPVVEGESRWPLLMLRAGDKLIALHVDVMLGSFEIVVKPVGPQLSQVGGIAGATILGDGRVVLILDIPGLVRSGKVVAHLHHEEGDAGAEGAAVTATSSRPAAVEKPLIMVVDDSITMRKVATRMLTKNGFEVETAKDGVDALAKLQDIKPALMLLDIEMPRMDGYELASHVRNDTRLAETPIIMVTSRTGDKHRSHAMDLGVDRYFGKPYQEAEIMETIHELLEERAKAAG